MKNVENTSDHQWNSDNAVTSVEGEGTEHTGQTTETEDMMRPALTDPLSATLVTTKDANDNTKSGKSKIVIPNDNTNKRLKTTMSGRSKIEIPNVQSASLNSATGNSTNSVNSPIFSGHTPLTFHVKSKSLNS